MSKGYFSDQKFDNLDWISKAIAPWESKLATIIAALPDRIPITTQFVVNCLNQNHHDLSIQYVISKESRLLKEHTDDIISVGNDFLQKFFKWELPPDAYLKPSSLEMSEINLIKIKPSMDDIDHKNLAISIISRKGLWGGVSTNQLPRAKEIAELLGLNATNCKSLKGRNIGYTINHKISAIITEDEWRIRSIDLVEKMIDWAGDYINTGNISSLANFAKLKIMTHSGQPIYSIQEEQ